MVLAMMVIMTVLTASAIKPIKVKYTCDVTQINKQMGDKRKKWTLNDPNGGWCYVRNESTRSVGHNGILIYKNPYTGKFRVYDLKCPICDKKKRNSSIRMDYSVTATCPKCKTSFNLCGVGHPVNSMDTEAYLEAYDFWMKGNIMHIDNSPGFNQRYNLWLSDYYSNPDNLKK